MNRRVVVGIVIVVVVFVWVFSLSCRTAAGVPVLTRTFAPSAPCFPNSAASQDVAFWSSRWEEALQQGMGVLSADLSFDTEELRALHLETGSTVHVTSYHLWRGNGLSNWAAWLRASSEPSLRLIAFVPSEDTAARAAGVEGVSAVPIGAVLEPFVLCQRDLGSGVKVRALMELLRRGLDVWYSDADVVWLRPPSALTVEPKADLIMQIYGTGEGVAKGNFGLNMGLFFCRGSSVRLQGVMRKLFRAMTRSFVVQTNGGLDTCNDQNCLNSLLMRWHPELVCGWYFLGKFYVRDGAEARSCIVLQLLDPNEAGMAERLGAGHEGLVALHMTGYRGGHTFAKMFALQEHSLWRGAVAVPAASARFLLLRKESTPSEQMLKVRRKRKCA
jgi:hypothetical protein